MLARARMYWHEPIGVARTPFLDKAEAPRQPRAAEGTPGRIELYPGRGFEFALEDLAGWDRIWVLFVFDKAEGFKPKVQPPRSDVRRGLFSTRSPHRPNAIGMSALKLCGVDGLNVHVSDVDLLDGTPVLDIKPYVPYADAFPEAATGWLAEPAVSGQTPLDPRLSYVVRLSERAALQLAWLRAEGVDLESRLHTALELGPAPHPYRRIRKQGAVCTLSLKEWRVDFAWGDACAEVAQLRTGYKPQQRHEMSELGLHRDFVEAFGE